MECFIKDGLKQKRAIILSEIFVCTVNKLINFTRKFIHLCNYYYYLVRIADHLFEI